MSVVVARVRLAEFCHIVDLTQRSGPDSFLDGSRKYVYEWVDTYGQSSSYVLNLYKFNGPSFPVGNPWEK